MTTLQFLGAAQTVTGSCFFLQHGSTRIMIDCGLVQGSPDLVGRNGMPFAVEPSSLDAVVLTHAHLDHTGLVPRLIRHGFRGRIVTTMATRELLPILWDDYVSLQRVRRDVEESSAESTALYDRRDVDTALSLCEGYGYDKSIAVTPACRIRFSDAGHILGSAIVEIWLKEGLVERKVVFSGDLGQKGKPIVRDPATVDHADVLVLESTYGDRNHRGMSETVTELGRAVLETLSAGGMVLMPVYAIGRSQEVMYVINQLTLNGILDRPRVFLDSPMAIRAAEVYARHVNTFDDEALRMITNPPANPRAPIVRYTEAAAASRSLVRVTGAVILAGSGMCEGGRIQEHLARHLEDPRACIIFTGYQVEGTLGRRLVDGVRHVRIMGKMRAVRARIHTINGLSAHADQQGLLEWVGAFHDPKPQVFLVHGEPRKMASLGLALEKRFGLKVAMPAWQETVVLA